MYIGMNEVYRGMNEVYIGMDEVLSQNFPFTSVMPVHCWQERPNYGSIQRML